MESSRKKDATAADFDIEGFVHNNNDAAAQNHTRTTTTTTTTTATYPMFVTSYCTIPSYTVGHGHLNPCDD